MVVIVKGLCHFEVLWPWLWTGAMALQGQGGRKIRIREKEG